MLASRWIAPLQAAFLALIASTGVAQPELVFDLATRDPDAGDYFRGFGFNNNGLQGTPVASGCDMDGDGHVDCALALMRSSPGGVPDAGRAVLFFGNGVIHGEVDGSVASANVLHINGQQAKEYTGSETWMGDVTGDGLGDLLLCRQGHAPAIVPPPGSWTFGNSGSNHYTLAAISSADICVSPLATNDPTMLLAVGARYTVTVTNSGTHPFQIVARAASSAEDVVLLSMGAATGSFEGNGAVNFIDNGSSVSFTMTQDLANAMVQSGRSPGYRSSSSPDLMRGAITVLRGGEGAGALSIVIGSPDLRTHAQGLSGYSLANPPGSIAQVDIYGRSVYDRLGIWARVGDVDGDGIEDVVVAADQVSERATHAGEIWVIRGGAHLAASQSIYLGQSITGPLAGNVARILPPPIAEQHFGSTLFVGDLDGNGRAEIIACVDALNRSGAGLPPTTAPSGTWHASSVDSRDGAGWIVWDDNFPAAPWPADFTIDLASPPGSTSRIDGPTSFDSFGEELIGGEDFDNDGNADILFADLTASATRGVAKVLYNAPLLKNEVFDLDTAQSIPDGVAVVTITGPSVGAIGIDTVMQGDFNGDGIGDLAVGNPQDDPDNRMNAGTIHVLYGKNGLWPASINLAAGAIPPPSQVRIAQINGRFPQDILCYSAAYGDVDGDGRDDIVTNEMTGDAPTGSGVGNLIVIPGSRLLDPPLREWMVIE